MKKNKGFALLATVYIIIVLGGLAAVFVSLLFYESRMAISEYRYNKAFYIAEAGKAYGIKYLTSYSDWSAEMGFPFTKTFGGGCFTLSTANATEDAISLISYGIVTSEGITYQRGIQVELLQEEIPLGGGALYALGSITIDKADITGDISAMGDITIDPGASISGEVNDNIAPPPDPPDLDTTYYDGQITIASTFPAGAVGYDSGAMSGWYYVNGNVTFNNGANITVTGSATIVATGTVLVSNNVALGNKLTVIADGFVTIKNNSTIGNNGVWFSSIGFEVGNNIEAGSVVVGEGTVFLTPGDVDLSNNSSVYGFIFAEGTVTITNNAVFEGIIIAGDIDVENNASITYVADVVDIDSIVGVTGSEGFIVTISEWSELY
ncbi:MAG: hypothetical protein KKB81_03285 [Candidatus Margulisbacteria bacterium]|nr:hypothetical protein [Candidatus Margulisiibacteriota bacterium]MBU1022269.1 hypothetical protein [Candidatus Margulisiibacteriota bacterium]MBU1729292.1 hypothetical protein [Candidatus Margulisiibacteriota bacterium]MBU1955565.1 hypothetical protein [Candidatus Margulisiibacteriota bacterium]